MPMYHVDFTVNIEAENSKEAEEKAIRYLRGKRVRKAHVCNIEKYNP